ncbi:MAG TPA: zinc-dependent metalloprotease [Flavisolibacter sp.]|jgi:hypothetical protein|nr:zinc-dependent metalloprotease [Flavisolibacter sp.]
MKTKFLLALAAALLTLPAFSQFVCGFDDVHQKKLKTDPHYRQVIEENEKQIQRYITKNKRSLTARTTGVNSVLYTIPVVVHVMHTGGSVGTIYNPSDAQIQGAINYLNEVYNGTYPGTQGIGDIQIQFALAVRDPNCNATNGIERVDASAVSGYSTDGVSTNPGINPGVGELSIKDLSRWNTSQYYNIWIVNKINGKDGTSGSFTAGFAYYPGASPSYDGTIMLATQMASGRKTLPHEIGHAFGLYHTFEGSADKNTCPANTDCTTQGDRVCDTDPISFNQLSGVTDFSCRSGENSCTGTGYSINTESNYMNYTTCYTLFTAGQKARMLANAEGPFRKSLSTSMALSPSYPIAAYSNPGAASCAPATGATGLGGNYAGVLNIDINNKSLGSSTARNDNGYVNGTNSCLNLIQLTRGSTYSFGATVLSSNYEQLRAWIDYNNDGDFDNTTEQIHFTSSIARGSGKTTVNFTVPTSATLNTMLRMRVIDELSDAHGLPAISGACYNPTYGQAEDYPVYIVSGALPVTLVSFDGVLKNNSAQLSWKTVSAEGMKHFTVEKSTDGIHFTTIGTVPAVNQAAMKEYAFSDGQLAENNYYRLRLHERDGSSKLSQVVAIRYNGMQQKVWVVNNPFFDHLELGFGKSASQVRLQLINTNGVLVAEKTIAAVQGQYRWNLPANLSRGSYIVKAMVADEVFVMKTVKQ